MLSKCRYILGAMAGRPRLPGGRFRAWGTLLVLASLALEVVGCNSGFRPIDWPELGAKKQSQPQQLRVVPRKNRDRARLAPDDIVRIMQRVGFADDQILELGTDLHNALLISGAAAVIYGKQTEVLFTVKGEHLFIQARGRSGMVYDMPRQRFGLTTPLSNGEY